MWAAIKRFVLLLFAYRVPEPQADPTKAATPSPFTPSKPGDMPGFVEVAPAEVPEADQTWGSFGRLDGILDRLDNYYDGLRDLKRWDRDAYDLYAKIGGLVTNMKGTLFVVGGLPESWRDRSERPAFSLVHWGIGEDDDDLIELRFSYFQKVKWRTGIQPAKGDIYEMRLFYKDAQYPKLTHAQSFFVSVDADCNVSLLKQALTEYQHVGKSYGPKSGGTIRHKKWKVPSSLLMLCESWNESEKWAGKCTPEIVARTVFTMTANLQENAGTGVLVRAKRGGLTAAFNIGMLASVDFFKDRAKTVTVNGATRKIFHAVRPHVRIVNGRERIVRHHFRGEKAFHWNGCDVRITLPGRDHVDWQRFNVATVEQEDAGADTMSMKEAGALMDRSMTVQ